MHLLFSWCAVMLLAARATAGDAVSYVVLNDGPVNSLVRISAEGQTVTTIAHGAGGLGLAVDLKGDYIVAAVSKLLRVTPSGVVSLIANTPSGSAWISVTTETSGNFLVVDNQRHALWRVTADGAIVERISFYPARPDELDSAKIIPDGAGGYLLSNRTMEVTSFGLKTPGLPRRFPCAASLSPVAAKSSWTERGSISCHRAQVRFFVWHRMERPSFSRSCPVLTLVDWPAIPTLVKSWSR